MGGPKGANMKASEEVYTFLEAFCRMNFKCSLISFSDKYFMRRRQL